MIRAVWNVFVIVLLLHLIAVLGFGAWLYTSGRMDKQRLAAVYEMFKPTVAEQAAEETRLAAEIEAQRINQEKAIRMQKAGKDGQLTLSDRITADRELDEATQLKLDRLDRAKSDIQGQIERAQAALAQQSAQLEAARAEFDAYVAKRTGLMTDEDFKQAVALLSAQKPKQAKAMLQAMLTEGEQERVVNYLAAMQNRIAAKVLAEFKDPAEVEQATELVNALRARGVFTRAQPGEAGDNGA